MKQPKIAIIGAGAVGSTTAYTLMMRNIASKIILVDISDSKCKGEVADLTDALAFSKTSEIEQGNLHDAGRADIAIITAGIPQKSGQSRRELLDVNSEIIENVINGMKPLNPELIIIMVTNPVDILTFIAQKISGLPRNQIFGSGTLLDTNRLLYLISNKVGISQKSIQAFVLGEHGDSQFVAWSSAHIAGIPLLNFPGLSTLELHRMAGIAKNKVYDIIAAKGSTAFGVASCVSAYCESIIGDTKTVIPVSCYIEKYDFCMNMPAVIGKEGIKQILIPSLNDEEHAQLHNSAHIFKKYLNQ